MKIDTNLQTATDNNKEGMPLQEDPHEVLKKRALLLSKTENRADSDLGSTVEIVEFQLDSELYGIETQYVKEVRHYTKFATIPMAIPHTIGLVNSRGEIFSLIGLKSIFGLSPHSTHQGIEVIILNNKEIRIGLVVDKIVRMTWYKSNCTQSASEIFGEHTLPYIKEVTLDKVGIIDIEAIYKTDGIS